MLSLNLVVRAVIVHEHKLLVTALDDGKRPLFYTLLGGHLHLGESLLECVKREVDEEIGLQTVPSKLLYIVENYFARETERLHEIGYYFLCHPAQPVAGELLDLLDPNFEEWISPELMSGDELRASEFQPSALKELLARDLAAKFAEGPKLVVINELPGDVEAESGIYRL